MIMLSFEQHYAQFLGYDPADQRPVIVCHSPLRDKIGGVREPLITATVNSRQRVFSLSNDLMEDIGGELANDANQEMPNDELYALLDDMMFDHFKTYTIARFYRMTLTQDRLSVEPREAGSVSLLSVDDKELWMRDIITERGHRGTKYIERVWQDLLPIITGGRYFIVKKVDAIACAAGIDHIDMGGGNIYVMTNARDRRKGFGRATVYQATRWCLEHDIRPIYNVDVTNEASVALARGLGFEIKATEIQVRHWPGDASDKYRIKDTTAESE